MCNEEHIRYFKFIGRVAGMAVYHGKLLDGRLFFFCLEDIGIFYAMNDEICIYEFIMSKIKYSLYVTLLMYLISTNI